MDGRSVGDALTPQERGLLDLLCSGEGPAATAARHQLRTAVWGGYEHQGCECFRLLNVGDDGAPHIPHEGGPFSVVEVSSGDQTQGFLELWVVDGVLHSVTYIPLEDDHHALPTSESFDLTFTG